MTTIIGILGIVILVVTLIILIKLNNKLESLLNTWDTFEIDKQETKQLDPEKAMKILQSYDFTKPLQKYNFNEPLQDQTKKKSNVNDIYIDKDKCFVIKDNKMYLYTKTFMKMVKENRYGYISGFIYTNSLYLKNFKTDNTIAFDIIENKDTYTLLCMAPNHEIFNIESKYRDFRDTIRLGSFMALNKTKEDYDYVFKKCDI